MVLRFGSYVNIRSAISISRYRKLIAILTKYHIARCITACMCNEISYYSHRLYIQFNDSRNMCKLASKQIL